MKLDASFSSQIYSNDINTTCTSFVTNRHKITSWKCPDANMAAMTGLDETMPKCAPNSTPPTTNWTLDQRWESPSSSKLKKWDDFSLTFDSWLGWWTSRRNRLLFVWTRAGRIRKRKRVCSAIRPAATNRSISSFQQLVLRGMPSLWTGFHRVVSKHFN